MKAQQYIFMALVSISLLTIGCEEQDGVEVYNGGDNFHFLEAESSTDESTALPIEIPVVFTKSSPKSGTVSFTVTSDNATENVDYVILNTETSFTFADTDYTNTISIQPIDNQILDGNKELVVTLSSSTESVGWPGPDALHSTHIFTILDDDCDVPLVGSYTEVTAGGQGDGAGAIGAGGEVDPFPWGVILNVSKISCDGDGKYLIDDITMGLYPVGYGSAANNATFINNGGSLTIIEDESPDYVYGGDAFFGTGGIVNDDTFTLNWANSWGDQGNSTLSRQ